MTYRCWHYNTCGVRWAFSRYTCSVGRSGTSLLQCPDCWNGGGIVASSETRQSLLEVGVATRSVSEVCGTRYFDLTTFAKLRAVAEVFLVRVIRGRSFPRVIQRRHKTSVKEPRGQQNAWDSKRREFESHSFGSI
jgi:hypothetical protein